MTSKHEQFSGAEEQEIPAGESGAAEQETGKEKELSVEGIKRCREELEARVEAAKQQKAENIEKKLSDRESLIIEERENDELLQAARDAFEYFSTTKELGELDDDESIEQFKEVQAIVASLEGARVEIEKRIDAISSQPEIYDKLVKFAKEEGKEREVQKISDEAREQLEPQIDSLAESIKDLTEKQQALLDQLKEHKESASSTWEKIRELIKRAEEAVPNTSTDYDLQRIRTGGDRVMADEKIIKSQLEEVRGKLGLFRGKEKAAIDSVLSLKNAHAFETLTEAVNKVSELRAEVDSLGEQVSELTDQYKGIILGAWEAENKIIELGFRSGSLPSGLSHNLNRNIEKFADVMHWEKGKQVGRYEGWHDAMQQVPKNRTLRDIYDAIVRGAGGSTLVHRNPKEKAEQ